MRGFMDTIKKKINHLIQNFDFKMEELGEVEKMYRGQFFDPKDKAYVRLLKLSRELCTEFSSLNGQINQDTTKKERKAIRRRRHQIINLLFPIHGILSGVGDRLSVVIGTVDFLGCGYMNRAVHFSPYTLVECKNYTIFATKIDVGDEEVERLGNLIKLNRVRIGKNTWICAGVKIAGGVSIGDGTVIGAGAEVKDSIPSNVLAVGRPCKVVKKVTRQPLDKYHEVNLEKKQKILAHLASLGFTRGLNGYIKMLEGKKFNSIDVVLGKLFNLSHELSNEYNNPNTSKARKEDILDILFPHHGVNLKVGTDLYVDMLGMTEIGDNVTIGKSVYMSGAVTIGDNVSIGDNVLLYGTGHSIVANERKVGFSVTKGLYEYSQSSPIEIKGNKKIGKNSIISPNSIVDEDLKENSLYVRNKVIK
ncbi:MAG: hypothetical protein E7351_00145 [Clostridiales bacterium]|nr:hypothetical protein [Clostridiales bacterium]